MVRYAHSHIPVRVKQAMSTHERGEHFVVHLSAGAKTGVCAPNPVGVTGERDLFFVTTINKVAACAPVRACVCAGCAGFGDVVCGILDIASVC